MVVVEYVEQQRTDESWTSDRSADLELIELLTCLGLL
jgi:hypothetical protein